LSYAPMQYLYHPSRARGVQPEGKTPQSAARRLARRRTIKRPHTQEYVGRRLSVIYLRSIVLASILAPTPPPAHAQNVPANNQVPQRSRGRSTVKAADDAEVKALVNDSEELPPEFSADVSLTLVENGLVRDKALQLKLLNRAFEKAAASQDDVMERPFGSNVEETAEGLHAIASTVTRLNRISLQARVIQQLVALNPHRARRLFEAMPAPHLTEIPCNQNWYFSPDDYYKALEAVLKTGFSNGEIAGGDRAAYVSSITTNTQYHLQLALITRLLNTAGFTEQEFRTIMPVYAAAMAQLHGDPLSFHILLWRPEGLFDAISTLLTTLPGHNIDSRPLLHAFRDYVVLNFKGANCGTPKFSIDPETGLPTPIVRFNETFAARLKAANLASIRIEEIKTDAITTGDPPPPLARWNSPKYSQLLLAVQNLNPSPKDDGDPKDEDPQWLSKAQDVLTQLNSWSNEGEAEPESDFFHQKAILLGGLARRTIGTPLNPDALDSFVQFLEQNSYDEVSPIDWFVSVKLVFRMHAAQSGSRADLTHFIDSRNPVLSVYGRLQFLLQSAKQAPSDKGATQPAGRDRK